VSRYQKAKTDLDFTEARDGEWQWHQLDHMQVGTSLQRDNHTSTPPVSFLQAGCPFCCPTNHLPVIVSSDMNHIVDTCPLTKFEGGLNLLHKADDDAVIWVEFTATAALAK